MFRDFPVKIILRELERDNLLPGILFRTSRRQVDADLTTLSRVRGAIIPTEWQNRLHHEVEAIIEKYNLPKDVIVHHAHYPILIATGVGGHHAGQLLGWRLLLEELMSKGVLRLLIATGTVAAGVDFPARSVVITAHSKRGNEGFATLGASEFQQMSGRAGRRGKDSVGFCIAAPSPYCDARVLHEVANKPPEALRSSYFAAPSTVLNLLKFRNVDDLEYTVTRSLASFSDRKEAIALRAEAEKLERDLDNASSNDAQKRMMKRIARMRKESDTLENRQISYLKRSLFGLEALGFTAHGSLSEKGAWAAELCTSIVVELAEAINAGLFDEIPPEHLAGLVASLAGDAHRVYFNLRPNPIDKKAFKSLEEILQIIREKYDNPKANELMVQPDAALTIITWMESEDWNDFSGLMRLAKIAEGDVARLVTQTADHLNQIMRLHKSHPDLARNAELARYRLLRPPLTDTYIGG
jgi:ATP-dependent RNA helicase HelY